MPFQFRFTSVQAQDGHTVNLRERGVTCIVGANNAGKSQLLKDLVEHAKLGHEARLVVLKSATHSMLVGTQDEAEEWLERQAVKSEPTTFPPSYTLLPSGNGVDRNSFKQQLEYSSANGSLGHLYEAFVRRISAGSLSSYTAGHLRTDWSPDQHMNWLLTTLYSDGDLERELSELVSSFFALPVFVDRQNFPPRLRAGKVTVPAPVADALTNEYSRAVFDVPALDEQGDGLRSFTGLALVVLALSPEVLLLDEPESFLHPGQARAVGRWLASAATERNMQVVVATHDRDFLIGLLSSDESSAVDVVRIVRGPAGSELRTIPSEKLDSYWADPVLRYSNALQGLFHERVVVCEGDADCRFYSAVMEELAVAKGLRHIADDTLFVSSNGKNGIAKIIGVLADLGVHAAVIADFDVLNSKATLQAIISALDSEWTLEIEDSYVAMAKHVGSNANDFWKTVTKGGMAKIPRGGAFKAFKRIIEILAKSRLHVVQAGELEDFYPEEGKGSGWIGAALTDEAHKSDRAQELLAAVIPELG